MRLVSQRLFRWDRPVPKVEPMRTQVGLCAIALVVAGTVFSLVLALSRGAAAGESLKRSAEETELPQAVLASIKYRLREIGAGESAREDKFVRVTREPFPITSIAAWGCRPATQFDPQKDPQDPHEGKWIHVFVTSRGSDAMKTGKGLYPLGTVILKEKFADAAGTKPLLFTGMLKRGKGYNTKAGDWQFFVLNSDATIVTTDHTQSCIHCHAPLRATDFVSRRYLTAKVADGR
jgi:hypothetical protein